jgi:hypothetical protein
MLIRRSEEFKRAFAGATMHDFFNLLAVSVLLPLELITGVLSGMAEKMADSLSNAGVRGSKLVTARSRRQSSGRWTRSKTCLMAQVRTSLAGVERSRT